MSQAFKHPRFTRSLYACAVITTLATRAASGQTSSRAADSLRAIALRVTDLDMRRQLPSATTATVDSLLAFYSDSVVYEHPNAGAVVRGKETMRTSMAQYLGSVRSLHTDPPRVTTGHGVAIVETRSRMEIHDGGKWIPVERHGLRVIEFDARGLVRRLIDYPW